MLPEMIMDAIRRLYPEADAESGKGTTVELIYLFNEIIRTVSEMRMVIKISEKESCPGHDDYYAVHFFPDKVIYLSGGQTHYFRIDEAREGNWMQIGGRKFPNGVVYEFLSKVVNRSKEVEVKVENI